MFLDTFTIRCVDSLRCLRSSSVVLAAVLRAKETFSIGVDVKILCFSTHTFHAPLARSLAPVWVSVLCCAVAGAVASVCVCLLQAKGRFSSGYHRGVAFLCFSTRALHAPLVRQLSGGHTNNL